MVVVNDDRIQALLSRGSSEASLSRRFYQASCSRGSGQASFSRASSEASLTRSLYLVASYATIPIEKTQRCTRRTGNTGRPLI